MSQKRAARAIVRITLGWAALFIATGYRGFGGDHIQYLLPAFRDRDPSFAAGDWFVYHTTPYHYLFQTVGGWLLGHDGLTAGLLIWHLLTLFVLAWAVDRWIVVLEGGELAYVVAIALIATLRWRGWGDHPATAPVAEPAYLGIALGLAVLWAVYRRRPLVAAVLLLATTYVHADVGLWTAVIALPGFIVTALQRPLPWGRVASAVFLTIVGLAPLAYHALGSFGATGNTATFDVLFYGRSPHHYAPHLAAAQVHLHSAALVAVAFLGAYLGRNRQVLLAFLAAAVFSLVLGLAALPVLHWTTLARSFPFRTMPILALLGFVWLAVAATRAASDAYHRRQKRLLLALVALFLIAGAKLTFDKHPGFGRSWPRVELAKLAAAVRSYTPVGSVLVVPPGLAGLRIAASRAVVVNFKCIPLAAAEIEQWRERMQVITGLDPGRAREWLHGDTHALMAAYDAGYRGRQVSDLRRAAARYSASYAVVEPSSAFAIAMDNAHVTPLWQSRRYRLYRLSK